MEANIIIVIYQAAEESEDSDSDDENSCPNPVHEDQDVQAEEEAFDNDKGQAAFNKNETGTTHSRAIAEMKEIGISMTCSGELTARTLFPKVSQ